MGWVICDIHKEGSWDTDVKSPRQTPKDLNPKSLPEKMEKKGRTLMGIISWKEEIETGPGYTRIKNVYRGLLKG